MLHTTRLSVRPARLALNLCLAEPRSVTLLGVTVIDAFTAAGGGGVDGGGVDAGVVRRLTPARVNTADG
jgi:hypothetical protein